MATLRPFIVVCLALAGIAAGMAAPAAAETRYRLTDAERALDCRKLTGRMTVRLMQLRSEPGRGASAPSAFSEAIGGVARPAATLFWGKSASAVTDSTGRLASDRAQVHAYNGLLREKGCAVFDVDAELAKAADAPPPRPVKAKSEKR